MVMLLVLFVSQRRAKADAVGEGHSWVVEETHATCPSAAVEVAVDFDDRMLVLCRVSVGLAHEEQREQAHSCLIQK